MMDEAFQKFRAKHFGAYQAYPVDAYTYFCSGWKAREGAAVPAFSCDGCDNGVDLEWEYCPWCGRTKDWTPIASPV